jgi:predicted RNase H-like HicB family nuclease
MTYRTIIQKDNKGYHAFVPALPGCHTYDYSINKVRKNLKQAIKGWIEARKSKGWEIPVDETLETLESVEIDSQPKNQRIFSYA